MPKSKIQGLTIEIGGNTTGLTKALKDPNKAIAELQSQIRSLDKALKVDPTNIELLEQKMRLLSRAIDETENKLQILKTAQEQFKASGKNIDSSEYIELEKQIALTQQSLNKLNAQKVQLDVDISSVKNANGDLEQLDDSINDANNAAKNAKEGFTIMKGAVSDLVSSAIQGCISALNDLIGSLFGVSEATEEYRSMLAKIEGSANSFGYSTAYAREEYEKFYSYLGEDQMATNAITNLLGMKVSTDTVTNSANAAIGVWSAYGDSIPIEGLTESITESARVAQVTGSLADAINWAERSNEDWSAALAGNTAAQKAFNKAIAQGETQEDAYSAALAACTSTQERADLIAQTLNATYGESKATYDEVAGSIIDANEAELELKDTQAELGETMQPVNTALTSLKNDALEAILPLITDLAAGAANLLEWMRQHPEAVKAITAVVIGLAVAIGTLAIALNIGPIISSVTTAFTALNAAMMANPYILVASLIAGLVAAFITLWNTSEEFRNFWIGLWNGLCSLVDTSIQAIVNFFGNMIVGIQNAIGGIGNWIGNVFLDGYNLVTQTFSGVGTWFGQRVNDVKNAFSGIAQWFSNIFTGAWNAVKNVFSGWTSFFSGLWNSISSTFSRIGTNISNAISGSLKSGMNGVISSIESIINSGINLINSAINLINKIPGVNIGKIGRLRLPRLAEGGYATGSTLANIGEAGREVVLPLDRNTEWAGILTSLISKSLLGNLKTLMAEVQKMNNYQNDIIIYDNIELNLDGDTVYKKVVRKITKNQGGKLTFKGA